MARLPDILLVGAQKGGTTTLHAALAAHPRLASARRPETGEPVKEVHFFDNQWTRGVAWYAANFEGGPGSAIDSTPNYLSLLAAHERMKSVVPNARILISLRDPVERCFSQYNHYLQDLPRSEGWDWLRPGESLEANVRAELERGEPLEPRYRGLLGRGYYVDQLQHLLEHYSREQILILVLERWSRDPQVAVACVLDFLGLPHPENPLPIEVKHRREVTAEPMNAEVRALLRGVFDPYNQRLFELLGEEIAEWSGEFERD